MGAELREDVREERHALKTYSLRCFAYNTPDEISRPAGHRSPVRACRPSGPKALAHHQRHHQRESRAPAARRAGITPSSIDAPSADRKLGALLARDAEILRRTISEMYGQSPFLIPAEFVRNDSTRCAGMVTPPPLARAMFLRAE